MSYKFPEVGVFRDGSLLFLWQSQTDTKRQDVTSVTPPPPRFLDQFP